MIHSTTNCVVFTVTSEGRRHHHSVVDMPSVYSEDGEYTTGDKVPVVAPDSFVYKGKIVNFAFASVKGTATGSHLYTSNANIPKMKVGSTDMQAIVVYLPAGGGGEGTMPLIVDAFNVDIGDFSDSDFIEVSTNGAQDVPKTKIANDDGTIDTSLSAVDIKAFDHVDTVPFTEWQKIQNDMATTFTDRGQHVDQDEKGFFFAFYHTPPRHGGGSGPGIPEIDPNKYRAGWIYVSLGVKRDGGGFVVGPGGKIGPPVGPLARGLIRLFARISAGFNGGKLASRQDITSAAGALDEIQGKTGQIL